MAINTYYKTTTYGIDKIIKSVQLHLKNKLKWSGVVDIYGKVERTEKERGFTAEVWTSNKEYKEIFINDKVDAVIGFYPKTTRPIDGYNQEVVVDVICTCNLTKIFANTNRDDEKAIMDLLKVLKSANYVNSADQIKVTIPTVFSDFDTSLIKHRDMQPLFVFSIEITIKFQEDDC